MTCPDDEIWAPVSGYAGLYEVSSTGRIRSYAKSKAGKLIRITKNKKGYLRVSLHCKGVRKTVFVHRLVADAFIQNPENLPEVNHIDSNKENNCVENLEWCTSRQNTMHAMRHNPDFMAGLKKYNDDYICRPVLRMDRRNGFIIARYKSAAEAQEKTGICARDILYCANKTPYNSSGAYRKTAGGYQWKFEEEHRCRQKL